MQLPRRGEKGFTLIELLIVVAILGVLAAVVVPNVGRFIGRGEAEAKATEMANIQSAVIAMMTDNGLPTLPNPVLVADATRDMAAFPDATSVCATDKLLDPNGDAYATPGDQDGYVLFQHDVDADGAATGLVNYVVTQTTKYWYSVDTMGTVTQYDTDPSP